MRVSRRLYRWTFGVFLTGALAAAAMPAAAQQEPNNRHSRGPNYPFEYGCFGHNKLFRASTSVALVDWDADGTLDECFGIANDKSIWHVTLRSGGWQPMGGQATNVFLAFRTDKGERQFTVIVNTLAGIETWGSTLTRSGWGKWEWLAVSPS